MAPSESPRQPAGVPSDGVPAAPPADPALRGVDRILAQRPRTGALVLATVGLVGTVVAVRLLPWAYYGAFAVPLWRLPHWHWFPAAAAALHACVAVAVLRRPRRGRRTAALIGVGALAVLTAGTAVLVMSGYTDGHAIFGPFVPAVVPMPGPGGPLAVASTVASAAAPLVAWLPERRADAAAR